MPYSFQVGQDAFNFRATRDQLATAMFEWIECWYNPHRRHSYNNGLSPLDYETANAA